MTILAAIVIYLPWNKSFNPSPGTQSIDRGAQLLTLVLEAEAPRALGELAADAGLPKSTASRLLGALERNGLVEQEGLRGAFRAGPVMARFAGRGISARRLIDAAERPMAALADATGETINVAVAGPAGVEHLAQVETTHYLGTSHWVGRRVPYHCSANGKVLLAFAAAGAQPGALEALTSKTIVEPALLGAELERIRRDGFATAVDELELGLSAVAAPVLDESGPRRRRAQRLRPDAAALAAARGRAPPHRHQAGQGARGAARPPSRGSARRMTPDEILTLLYEETLVGNAPAVKDGVNEGIAQGMDPGTLLYDALIPSLEEVGARFERGDYFVPEMLIAARAMQGALDILRPLLAETGAKPMGKFLMGTVKGDVHDIGKNLCNIMLEGAGFIVIDLGVNVPPEKFVEQINEHEPDIVGFSAFLTTTMPMFKANMNALQKAGIRDKVAVMVGGAPVTQEYADAVGADGYSADASSAVKKAKELLEQRRAAVPA